MEQSCCVGLLVMIVLWILQILLDNMVYADDDEALQDEDVRCYKSSTPFVVIFSLERKMSVLFCFFYFLQPFSTQQS